MGRRVGGQGLITGARSDPVVRSGRAGKGREKRRTPTPSPSRRVSTRYGLEDVGPSRSGVIQYPESSPPLPGSTCAHRMTGGGVVRWRASHVCALKFKESAGDGAGYLSGRYATRILNESGDLRAPRTGPTGPHGISHRAPGPRRIPPPPPS